jgi:hypothetical protein
MTYGIRITRVSWAAIDGGPDLHGTKEQMYAIAARWQADALLGNPDEVVQYEVVPYVGRDPAEADVVAAFLARGDD